MSSINLTRNELSWIGKNAIQKNGGNVRNKGKRVAKQYNWPLCTTSGNRTRDLDVWPTQIERLSHWEPSWAVRDEVWGSTFFRHSTDKTNWYTFIDWRRHSSKIHRNQKRKVAFHPCWNTRNKFKGSTHTDPFVNVQNMKTTKEVVTIIDRTRRHIKKEGRARFFSSVPNSRAKHICLFIFHPSTPPSNPI